MAIIDNPHYYNVCTGEAGIFQIRRGGGWGSRQLHRVTLSKSNLHVRVAEVVTKFHVVRDISKLVKNIAPVSLVKNNLTLISQ